MLDERLLEILVCPKCRGELDYRTEPEALVCPVCQLRYRVVDDIPVMLIDEAEPLNEPEAPARGA